VWEKRKTKRKIKKGLSFQFTDDDLPTAKSDEQLE
jgi:hypothetical protein